MCSASGINRKSGLYSFDVRTRLQNVSADSLVRTWMGRISRCGTQHSKLSATFVYVKETLSENIYKYHEDRRNGKSMKEAAKRFEDDDPHDFSPQKDFYRHGYANPFTDIRFSVKQLPTQSWAELFASETDINDAFDLICDATRNSEDYEITLTFPAHKRPALYEQFVQIVVTVKDGFTLTFDLPPWSMESFTKIATLTVTINLTDAQTKCLDDIDKWHRRETDGVTIHAVRGARVSLPYIQWFERVGAIKASCSSCRWCGWRRVHKYDAPFIGMCPEVREKNDRGDYDLVLNEHIQTVRSERGILRPQISYGHDERTVLDAHPQFHIWNGNHKLRSYMDVVKSKTSRIEISKPIHFKQMSASFFEKNSTFYA